MSTDQDVTHAPAFATNCVIIAQSLEPEDMEVQTGHALGKYIHGLPLFQSARLDLQVYNIESAIAFEDFLKAVIVEARRGCRPILQVECHGSEESGLQFSNGSEMPWERLAALLRDLNVATEFNLVASFAACFGAHFLSQMGTLGECPCYALVAPTKTVMPHELMAGYREFYRVLFQDLYVTNAVQAMQAIPLSKGEWLAEVADGWFLRVATDYVKRQCTEEVMQGRIKAVLEKAAAMGMMATFDALKGQMIEHHAPSLDEYFNRYFAVALVPKNAQRFKPAQVRLAQFLMEARATGRYWI